MERTGYGNRIAGRMAQVVGSGPRIDALANDEMSDEARAIVDGVRASAGAGPVADMPDYMRTIAKHPGLFKSQMETGKLFFQGLISPYERELAVLRIGWLAGAPYEWGEHVKIAKRYGVSSQQIERATQGSAAPGWTAHEAAILRGVEELLADFAVSDETWNILAQTWDEAQMLEYPAMVGQYVAIAFIQNSYRARLGEGNTGLELR